MSSIRQLGTKIFPKIRSTFFASDVQRKLMIVQGLSSSSTEGYGLAKSLKEPAISTKGIIKEACGTEPSVDDEDDDMEEMFVQGPAGMEWGGPTRGGQRPEPTRFGDWERKGRTSDF